MIVTNSQLLNATLNNYILFESKVILFESIIDNPKRYFVISENYKKYLSSKDYQILEEAIWDTIKDVGGKIKDYATSKPREMIQGVADVVSIFDPTGLVDLVNGIFYYYFKDYFSAFFSFLGASLTMGGLLLTATGGGSVVGIPMEVAGKAVQVTKVAVKAGKVATAGAKELAITAKLAKPAISKVASLVEKVPLVGGMGNWFLKSADNVSALVTKEGATMADVSRALGSTSTEISNNPVVKGFASRVVGAVKNQGLKPSVMQTGLAGLGIYGLWGNVEDAELESLAMIQIKEEFEKRGLKFDPNNKRVRASLPEVVEELRTEKNKCKKENERECRTHFEKFSRNYPKTAMAISNAGKTVLSGIQSGVNALEKTDMRNN
jgi:hypothetical protein